MTINTEIIDRNSPISFLQQRLNYAAQHQDNYISFVENVPVWPDSDLPLPKISPFSFQHYANCQGEPQILEAIAKRENELYNLNLRPENLLITHGAFHAISLITRMISGSGSILCPLPTLSSVVSILTKSNKPITYIPMDSTETLVERIKASCLQNNIQIVYLNIPHNPTGYVMEQDELADLIHFLAHHNIYLIMDAVYDSFIFNNTAFASPLSLIDDWSHIFLTNSMSKSYGAPGLRIGWIASAPANIEQLTSHFEAECISACTSSQEQAVQLLTHGNTKLYEHVHRNWFFVGKELQLLSLNNFTTPTGGTQYFVELPVHDIEAFADFALINQGLILVTSGNYFGIESQCIRVPIGHNQAALEAGIKRLSQALRDWSGLKKTENNSLL